MDQYQQIQNYPQAYPNYQTPSVADPQEAVKYFRIASWSFLAFIVMGIVNFLLSYSRMVFFYPLALPALYFLEIACAVLAGWSLTRMPQQSFRLGGFILMVYGGLILLSEILNFVHLSLEASAIFCLIYKPILLIVLTAAMLAMAFNNGTNYHGLSLFVGINFFLTVVGMVWCVTYVACGINFYQLNWLFPILDLCILWSWVMFFKHTSPVVPDDCGELDIVTVLSNRILIAISVLVVIAIIILFFLTNILG